MKYEVIINNKLYSVSNDIQAYKEQLFDCYNVYIHKRCSKRYYKNDIYNNKMVFRFIYDKEQYKLNHTVIYKYIFYTK